MSVKIIPGAMALTLIPLAHHSFAQKREAGYLLQGPRYLPFITVVICIGACPLALKAVVVFPSMVFPL